MKSNQCYLFVHFKEKRTPDGEQVYFGISRDGFHWEAVNNGQPVLWSMLGEKGVRDFSIARGNNGHFYILATDLCLSYEMRPTYHNSWREVQEYGSNKLMMWESEDLCHWSEQHELPLGAKGSGCHWAPDLIQDAVTNEYMLTWSQPDLTKDYKMCIYYSKTSDFKTFTEPAKLYEKEDSGVIDSCMAYENGMYYLWVKSDRNPCAVIMLKSESITGPFVRMTEFDAEMEGLTGGSGAYEAPTCVRIPDGSYTLMLDFFGVRGAGQGYVPFRSEDIASGVFKRSDEEFSYPYGFKHGTILAISEEEYERVKAFDYEAESYNR